MKFKSKKEAYSYALLQLYRIRPHYHSPEEIDRCIEKIKIAFENHEPDVTKIADELHALIEKELKEADEKLLLKLIKDMKASEYRQTIEERFSSPLVRRAESELPIELLLKPTKAMMLSVGRVSEEVLKLMARLKKNDELEPLQQKFLEALMEEKDVIGLGSFKKKPSFEEVEKILKESDPKKLCEIMLIHFQFAYIVYRKMGVEDAPVRVPTGKLYDLVREIWKAEDVENFFAKGIKDERQMRYRSFIPDEIFYGSPLYKKETNRGRKGALGARYKKGTVFSELGLMLDFHTGYAKGLPHHASGWLPDCKAQDADFTSAYVLELLMNEGLYVSGPSGMASLLLGQMEILANFENVILKQNYLSAVVAYIVGGGFHSLHEVIGPAEDALGLVPGYKVNVPGTIKDPPPPNYHQFFEQQSKIDPEFSQKRDLAWVQYLKFFNEIYAPVAIEDYDTDKTLKFPVAEKESKEDKPDIGEGSSYRFGK